MHRFTAPIYGSDPLVRSMALVRSMNRMVSWPVSRSVGRLVDGMVDWAVGLVVIGGWRRRLVWLVVIVFSFVVFISVAIFDLIVSKPWGSAQASQDHHHQVYALGVRWIDRVSPGPFG